MIIALLCGVFVIPVWCLSSTLSILLVGGFLMQFMVQGAWGIIPAHLSELSPNSVRGFLPGFAYQCGVALAGLVAFVQAVFAARTSYPVTMALTTLTVLVGAAVVTAFGREKRGINFGEAEIGE
jgi:SHS family lactate transporter-like MFS transporter